MVLKWTQNEEIQPLKDSRKNLGIKMKIVITGGAGFVGRNLVRYLYQSRYNMDDVVVIDYNKEYIKYVKKYGAHTVNVDLSCAGEWYEEFNKADIVINLAAQLSSPDYELFYRNKVIELN